MASSTVAPSAIVPEFLNLDNYEYWSRCVKNYLLAEDLGKVVEATSDNDPKLEDVGAWSRQDAKALHVIDICTGSAFFPLISDATSAGDAWNILAKKFKPEYFTTDESSNVPKLADGNMEREVTGLENKGINVAVDQEAYFTFFKEKVQSREVVDWIEVDGFLNKHPEAARMRYPPNSWTYLHSAVFRGDAKVVERMLKFFQERDLEIKDSIGYTAFGYALCRYENIEIVKCLVGKNKALVSTCIYYHPHKNVLPVLIVIILDNWEVARYLYHLTPPEALSPESGPYGADIISNCIQKKTFDIAWDLIKRYPKLAITKDLSGNYPLHLLAGMRSAFLSGRPLTHWYERWIYKGIPIPDLDFKVCTDARKPETDEENQMVPIESATERQVKSPFWHHIRRACNAVIRRFLQTVFIPLLNIRGTSDRIYEMKLVHARVFQLLECMSPLINANVQGLHDSVVQRAIFRAIQFGHVEFVTGLVRQTDPTYSVLGAINDKTCKNVIASAVQCRQEEIYNLVYDMSFEMRNAIQKSCDSFQNSLLHMVGTLSPSIQIRDAALQMQRELQWFEEVEDFVSYGLHDLEKLTDNMTARELFTKNHKDLVKEGEKSMKETATSCTVVGALIVTMMFAVVFSVAGGNDGSTGLPLFLEKKEKLFMVFIVSDALSLFSSITSVMIFLGILTSRYAEDDFLFILPTKMMVGLLTLFFSIATMMVAFSTTLIMMLRDKYSWRVELLILLACIPITSFVLMQSPLLYEICVSTYFGPGIFRKRRTRSRRLRLKKFYERMRGRVVRAFTPKSKNDV